MTIKFQNTKEDYLETLSFIFPKMLGFRWHIVLILGIVMLLLGMINGIYRYTHLQNYQWYAPGENGQMIFHEQQEDLQHALFSSVLLFGIGIVYLIWHFFRGRLHTISLLKKQAHLLEPSEITFSDEGIEIKRKSAKAYMEWSLVKAVYERPGFFGILFNANSFIPIMRYHLSEQEYSELRKLLQSKKEILTK